MTPVAELLRDSRAAHVASRAARAKGEDPAPQLRTALELRLEARRLDPDRLDMAWLDDALPLRPMPGEKQRRPHRIKGLTTPQVAREKDAQLVAFFREQLDREDVAPPDPLTEAEMLARVIVPKEFRTVKAGMTPCTCGHEKGTHRGARAKPCSIELAPGQPCPCANYTPAPCTHRWRVEGDRRVCAACDERQALFETMDAKDTAAFKQLQKENAR